MADPLSVSAAAAATGGASSSSSSYYSSVTATDGNSGEPSTSAERKEKPGAGDGGAVKLSKRTYRQPMTQKKRRVEPAKVEEASASSSEGSGSPAEDHPTGMRHRAGGRGEPEECESSDKEMHFAAGTKFKTARRQDTGLEMAHPRAGERAAQTNQTGGDHEKQTDSPRGCSSPKRRRVERVPTTPSPLPAGVQAVLEVQKSLIEFAKQADARTGQILLAQNQTARERIRANREFVMQQERVLQVVQNFLHHSEEGRHMMLSEPKEEETTWAEVVTFNADSQFLLTHHLLYGILPSNLAVPQHVRFPATIPVLKTQIPKMKDKWVVFAKLASGALPVGFVAPRGVVRLGGGRYRLQGSALRAV